MHQPFIHGRSRRGTPLWWRRRAATAVFAALSVVCAGGEASAAGSTTTVSTPLPPVSVTVAQAGLGPDLAVTWTPSASGSPATGAIVQLYDLTTSSHVADETCSAGCTSSVFRGLQFANAYGVLVWPGNSAGYGQDGASNTVTLTDACAQGACVSVNANTVLHPSDHAASGLLHSLFPVASETAALATLDTAMWRSAPTYSSNGTLTWSSWDVAQSQGIPTTLVLSDLWWGYTSGGQQTPWSDWTAYRSWVTSTVRQIVASGRRVNYWEVYNEPGNSGYYTSSLFSTVTPSVLLQQFLVAYKAIKSVIPDAAIIGPSLEHWSDTPHASTTTYRGFDMETFLQYAASNHLQLAAVSWHFINDSLGVYPSENTLSPQNVVDEIAEARRLIAALPAVGQPKIFVNEYGMPETETIPGWDVAYLAALTDGSVGSAGRACWGNDCADPDLDGLLSSDGSSTMPDYWVHDAYTRLTGSMVSTDSTDDNVAALASFNSGAATISVLVGRGQGCTQTAWCAQVWPWMTPAAPEPVTVTLNVPWSGGTATVSEADIPGAASSPTGAPATQSSTVAISPAGAGGQITLSIPSFADGDAYSLVVTKTA